MYLIDEEELNNVLNFHIPYFGTNTVSEIHKLVTTFLADKQPVVEVASGIVEIQPSEYDYYTIGGLSDFDLFDDLVGKNIKIYIVCEE